MAQTKLQQKLTKAITSVSSIQNPYPTIFPTDMWVLIPTYAKTTKPEYIYPALNNSTSPFHFDIPWTIAATLLDSKSVHNFPYPYRLVVAQNQHCYLEAGIGKDSLLVSATPDYLRISLVDENGDSAPYKAFKDMDANILSLVCLTLIRFVLEEDSKIDVGQGGGKLERAVTELVDAAAKNNPADWTVEGDIPDAILDNAYILTAATQILKTKMRIDCGADTSDIPAEVDPSYASKWTGALVAENLNSPLAANGQWEPRFVCASGKTAVLGTASMTIGDAKAMYSGFMAHRNWSEQEKRLIRQFPDDMPVMPEAMRIITRIVGTKDAKNPVTNVMWRGATAYGKSTGVQQVSCILNMPLLIQTCNSNMETADFFSTMLPASTTEGINLDENSILSGAPRQVSSVLDAPERPMPPHFEEAIAYLETLDPVERDKALSPSEFCVTMTMDLDSAVSQLIGKPDPDMEFDSVVWLYSEVLNALREAPYKKKIRELELVNESLEKTDKAGKSSGTEFVHVIAPYLKAMANGYMIEIQEASRIRDAGVLVGLNEFDRPGALISLMNGATVRRHKDAICFITDNVGYESCRPIDPSVIRRMGMVIDSFDLPKNLLFERIMRNTGITNATLLDKCHKLWLCAKEFCEQNAITDGSISPMELERFVQAVSLEGLEAMTTTALDDCVISKASSDLENQRDIRSACLTLAATI